LGIAAPAHWSFPSSDNAATTTGRRERR
jgi:hypothetical protein